MPAERDPETGTSQTAGAPEAVWGWVRSLLPVGIIVLVTVAFVDFQEMLEVNSLQAEKAKLQEHFIAEHSVETSVHEEVLAKVKSLGNAYDGTEDWSYLEPPPPPPKTEAQIKWELHQEERHHTQQVQLPQKPYFFPPPLEPPPPPPHLRGGKHQRVMRPMVLDAVTNETREMWPEDPRAPGRAVAPGLGAENKGDFLLERQHWDIIDNDQRRIEDAAGPPPPPARPDMPPYPPVAAGFADFDLDAEYHKIKAFQYVLPAESGCLSQPSGSMPVDKQAGLIARAKAFEHAEVIRESIQRLRAANEKKLSALGHHCLFFTQECADFRGGSVERREVRRGGYAGHRLTLAEIAHLQRGKSLYKGMLGTCAVVGNHDILLQRERGAEIDRHDTVIRVGHYVKVPPPAKEMVDTLRKNKKGRPIMEPAGGGPSKAANPWQAATGKGKKKVVKYASKFLADHPDWPEEFEPLRELHPMTPMIDGYEKAAGRKASITFVQDAETKLGSHATLPDMYRSTLVRPEVADMYVLQSWRNELGLHHTMDGAPFLAYTPETWQDLENLIAQMHNIFGGEKHCKGTPEFQTAMFFLTSGLCDHVDLYGFGGKPSYSYWDDGIHQNKPDKWYRAEWLAAHWLMQDRQTPACIYI